MQKHSLCRVFSCLVQTCQPAKGKKCEILNLELGKEVQINGYKAAGHKLWGKTRIVDNFDAERLQLNDILVPYRSKKNALGTTNLTGKERSFPVFFVCTVS